MRFLRVWVAGLALAVPAGSRAGNAEVEASVLVLRAAVADPLACAGLLCPRVLPVLDRSLAAFLAQRPALAVSYAMSAISLLERWSLVSGALEAPIAEVVTRTRERVLEAKGESSGKIAGLCSGVRPVARRYLLAPERYLTLADTQLANGKSSLALRYLGGALTSFDAATRVAGLFAARCRPRVCPGNAAPGFTPGDPANDSLALIPPDRGTLVDYEVSDLEDPAEGRVRLIFLGLSAYRTRQLIDVGGLGELRIDTTTTIGACSDAAGWVRRSSLAESALMRHVASGQYQRGTLSVRAVPAASVIESAAFTLPPQAAMLRVGDRLEETNIVLTGRFLPGGVFSLHCNLVHEVAAIETVTVPAGDFEAARIESRVDCYDVFQNDVSLATTWVASEVGEIKSESRNGAGTLLGSDQVTCFETPETAGSCGAF